MSTKLPFPKVVRIEPASACNFKCIHCPTGLDLNKSLGVMSYENFSKIIAKIEKYAPLRVIVLYHGGEPLLNRDFCNMIKESKKIATKVRTVTNGSLLTSRLINDLILSGLDEIEFSLDGNSQEDNDRIRVNANFNKISGRIIEFVKTRNKLGSLTPKVSISNTRFPESIDDIQKEPDPSEYLKKAFSEVANEINYKPAWALIWPGLPLKADNSQPDSNHCDNIISTITIRYNGDVVPCCYDLTSEMVMGNILNSEPEEIWNNNPYQELRQDIADYKPPKFCQNCNVIFSAKRLFLRHLNK